MKVMLKSRITMNGKIKDADSIVILDNDLANRLEKKGICQILEENVEESKAEAEAEIIAETTEEIDYSKMKIKELKEEAEKLEINIEGLKKDEIIEALETVRKVEGAY